MRVLSFIRKNGFVLGLLAAFLLTDLLVARWDPLTNSMRFRKNDFTKTLSHHNWETSGRVFFGNSAVTGAYIEDQAEYPLVEMGLSYGKLTDLQQILDRSLYDFKDELVLGIDVHTMLDLMETDPTYPWNSKRYQPYLYEYRDYFKETGTGMLKQILTSLRQSKPEEMFEYWAWNDKMLYFGEKPAEGPGSKQEDWLKYEQRYNYMRMPDFQKNLNALEWVIDYTQAHQLELKVVWMPYNPNYPLPGYMPELKAEVDRILSEHHIPVLDLLDRFEPQYFHDLVHINRELGAPLFTKEVDKWLLSFEKRSNS
ncbi:hypothetical protein [Paenibacillus sp. J2TS4]|uniref:hypothetical protein n=1 Tax=Paenibacillus sp. J2TS4 TaxID=2807194 RepID=UPI001B00222A|nr:hypothetical protein [Paenibacillus sp. J2TS4]GIP35643.1 hypothetical protein J2TS4_48530 [Paenibacillus sp. J2TS4]